MLTWRRDARGVAVDHAAGAVTYRHRGARLEVRTPAGVVQTRAATLHVEVRMKRQLIAGSAAGAIAAAVVIAVYDGSAEITAPPHAARPLAAGDEVALPLGGADRPVARLTRDTAIRQEIAAVIASARTTRSAAASRAPGGVDPVAAGATAAPTLLAPLSSEEIRASVREVMPLVQECYVHALELDPALRGRLEARLVVDSEPDVGMIVTVADTIDAMEGTGAASSEFRDCFAATLESVAFPPLPEGGQLEITYPFEFAPGGPDQLPEPSHEVVRGPR